MSIHTSVLNEEEEKNEEHIVSNLSCLHARLFQIMLISGPEILYSNFIVIISYYIVIKFIIFIVVFILHFAFYFIGNRALLENQ